MIDLIQYITLQSLQTAFPKAVTNNCVSVLKHMRGEEGTIYISLNYGGRLPVDIHRCAVGIFSTAHLYFFMHLAVCIDFHIITKTISYQV